MPRLIFFAPCERWLTSEEGSISLIGIMIGATFKTVVSSKAGTDTTKDLALPFRWATVTFWEREDGDEDKEFEQAVQLYSPSGIAVMGQISRFKVSKPMHRITVGFHGFPATEQGRYELKLFLREVGSEDALELSRTPMSVMYVEPSPENVS